MLLALVRRISSYTGPDVLLGLFETVEEVEFAKATYLVRYTGSPDADPWRQQAYKDDGLAAGDLQVESFECTATRGTDVFVVADYSEGFGQVVRKLNSVHRSRGSADERVAELDAADDMFPHYALVQEVRVGVLLSDAPEVQPRL